MGLKDRATTTSLHYSYTRRLVSPFTALNKYNKIHCTSKKSSIEATLQHVHLLLITLPMIKAILLKIINQLRDTPLVISFTLVIKILDK